MGSLSKIYLAAPVFIFQWQFDEAQMTADNVGAPVTQAQWNFIHHQGRNIRRTLESVNAVFAPSCISHTVITKPDWVRVTVAGVNLPDAVQCWASQSQPGELELQESQLRAVQNDDPVLSSSSSSSSHINIRRINSNMLKSMKKYNGSHKLRHRDVLDNRTNKRMRKRGRRKKKRCRYGDSLEERIKCAQEESQLYLHPDIRHLMKDRRNRDLVRNLDKREPQPQQHRRNRRRRRRRRQRSERVSREERKRIKREKRRRLRERAYREERLARRLSGRDRKQKLRHKNKSGLFDQSSNSGPESHVSVRSIQMRSQRGQQQPQPQCPQKHVDTCSRPQCNRSCPKLHNPLTGMDGATHILKFVSNDTHEK